MGQNSITMFTNDSGVAGGPTAYVQDAFQDISLKASNNTGFTSTALTNPLSDLFANDDSTKFGPKTLFIKDLLLERDRSKWINAEPTYRVIWNENFDGVSGYVWGNVQLIREDNYSYLEVRQSGDGFGISGVLRNAQFLLAGTQDNTPPTAQILVDGVLDNTITGFGTMTAAADPVNAGTPTNRTKRPNHGFIAKSTILSYNLHDIRIQGVQNSTLKIVGVSVHFENAGKNIDQFPGVTYNNKSRAQTSAAATLAIPTLGSTLGGNVLVYKTGSSYATSSLAATMLITEATGTGGGTVINVSAGHGGSFPAGTGFITSFGTSMFVGMVQSVSTDALTVTPALPAAGVSGTLYRYFQAGISVQINPSLMVLAGTIGASTFFNYSGFTSSVISQYGDVACFVRAGGPTLIDGVYAAWAPTPAAAGHFQVEGYFSAAEIEWVGQSFGILAGSIGVNGLTAYALANVGFTNTFKRTVFADAGPGWNKFQFIQGSSMINVGIKQVNLYKRAPDNSVTFGMLSQFDVLQAKTDRVVNWTTIAPGTYRRIYADQMFLQGTWVRHPGGSDGGGPVEWRGSNTNCAMRFGYFGKEYGLVTVGTPSINCSLDGVSIGTLNNALTQVAGETYHVFGFSLLGGTVIIQAFDYLRTYGEVTQLNNYDPILPKAQSELSEIRMSGTATFGSQNTKVRLFPILNKYTGKALTYRGNAIIGSVVQVNEDGVYAISYSDGRDSAGSMEFAIVVNSDRGATNPSTQFRQNILAFGQTDSGTDISTISTVAVLKQGDCIQCSNDGNGNQTDPFVRFSIVQIAKL